MEYPEQQKFELIGYQMQMRGMNGRFYVATQVKDMAMGDDAYGPIRIGTPGDTGENLDSVLAERDRLRLEVEKLRSEILTGFSERLNELEARTPRFGWKK